MVKAVFHEYGDPITEWRGEESDSVDRQVGGHSKKFYNILKNWNENTELGNGAYTCLNGRVPKLCQIQEARLKLKYPHIPKHRCRQNMFGSKVDPLSIQNMKTIWKNHVSMNVDYSMRTSSMKIIIQIFRLYITEENLKNILGSYSMTTEAMMTMFDRKE